MGLVSAVRRWNRRRQAAKAAPAEGPLKRQVPGTEERLRRFDAAKTHRLNREHWAYAHGESINNDLATDLPILMARCEFEYANNPTFKGVVDTYAQDVVGRDGPLLQVISDDEEFNDAVENAWRQVFAMPDPAGRLGGVENMRLWVRQLLLAGSYVNVFANVKREGPVSFGWRTVHPRRLVTPHGQAGNPLIAFGIEIDESGKPIRYYIDQPHQQGAFSLSGMNTKPYPAEMVQHRFIPVEPEQLTGFPQLASCLETAADIREYDKHVMEAAKSAAAHAVGLEASHPESVVDPQPIHEASYELEKGAVNVAPLGWSFKALDSTQPAAQYTDFRHERASELGRPIHMPLLIVLMQVNDVNFSAAQFGGTLYADGIKSTQGFIERLTLNQLVEQIVAELVIQGDVKRPKKVSLVWTWNVPPHANIEKYVKALRSMVEDGIIAPSDATAMMGRDWEKVVAARQRCAADLENAGLPPSPVNTGGAKGDPNIEEKEPAEDGEKVAAT